MKRLFIARASGYQLCGCRRSQVAFAMLDFCPFHGNRAQVGLTLYREAGPGQHFPLLLPIVENLQLLGEKNNPFPFPIV